MLPPRPLDKGRWGRSCLPLFSRKPGSGRGQKRNLLHPAGLHARRPTAGRVALQNHLSLPLLHGRAGATGTGRHLWHQRHPARAGTQFPAVPASLQEQPHQLPRSGAIPLLPSPGEHCDSCVPPPSPSGKQPDTRWPLPSQLSLLPGLFFNSLQRAWLAR